MLLSKELDQPQHVQGQQHEVKKENWVEQT
jgi:hypothetical protein